jgi:hypothetical protein
MHNDAYAHDLQMLNACLTPGCYNDNKEKKGGIKKRKEGGKTMITMSPILEEH